MNVLQNTTERLCRSLMMILVIGLLALTAQPTVLKAGIQDSKEAPKTDAAKTDTKKEDQDGKTKKDEKKKEEKPAPVPEPEPTDPWAFRPYKVKVWIVGDRSGRWQKPVLDEIAGYVKKDLILAEPSAWRVEASTVPAEWYTEIQSSTKDITQEIGSRLFDHLIGNDKLFIVRLKDLGNSFQIKTNEIDLKAWSNGPTFSDKVYQPGAVAFQASSQIKKAFRPVVMIAGRKDREVTCEIRAFGLLRRLSVDQEGTHYLRPATESPCWIKDQEVFEPILRKRNRKTKRYDLKGIKAMDFTLLVRKEESKSDQSEDTEEKSIYAAGRLQCEIVSAKRPSASLGRRFGKGVERIGLVVRNPPSDTIVKLITRRGNSLKTLQEVPLSGYEIYSRPIDKKSKSVYVGKTDWKGEIVITPGKDQDRVRVLLVKSGTRRLARLPLMPGYKPTRQITLPDDEDRLRAEGVVAGLQSQFLDLFALRGVLLAQLKLELQKPKPNFDRVEQIYKEYKSLRTISQWSDHVINNAERMSSYDIRQQQKIDGMFQTLKDVAKEHLKSKDDSEMQALYTQALKMKKESRNY